MLETERNQPMRVCASASGFSKRALASWKGVFTKPSPSSIGISFLTPALNVEPIDGATLRCSQATGFPLASRPASSRSTDTVVVGLLQIVVSSPGKLDRLPVYGLAQQPRLDEEVRLR